MQGLGRGRRALGTAVALVAAAVGVAAALEVAVRGLDISPPLNLQYAGQAADAALPFKPRPLSRVRGRAASGEFEFEYQHNGLGFRDTERPLEKPPGTFRIVALGDSFTYGAGAVFEETYPARLERLLGERAPAGVRVEVVKLGLPRYFPAMERRVLAEYGVRFEPDLVLVGVLPNDVLDTHLGSEAITPSASGLLLSREAASLGAVGLWLHLHSHAMRIVLARWVAYAQRRDRAVDPEEVYREGGRLEADWRSMEAELERMLTLARERDAGFALVGIPQKGPWDAHTAYFERRLARWSERHGALFVGTLEALRRAGGAPLYWELDGHCTGAGYAVIARAVAGALTQHRLVPVGSDGGR